MVFRQAAVWPLGGLFSGHCSGPDFGTRATKLERTATKKLPKMRTELVLAQITEKRQFLRYPENDLWVEYFTFRFRVMVVFVRGPVWQKVFAHPTVGAPSADNSPSALSARAGTITIKPIEEMKRKIFQFLCEAAGGPDTECQFQSKSETRMNGEKAKGSKMLKSNKNTS